MVLKRVSFLLGLCAICALCNPFFVSAQPPHPPGPGSGSPSMPPQEPDAECDPALEYPNNPPGEDGGCGAYSDCNGNGAFDLGEPCFEHTGPPSPPPVLAELIEDVLEEDELSDAASLMLEHLLMTPEERETAGEPDISEEDWENAEEEVNTILEDLLNDGDLDRDGEGYINMMLEHDHDGERHGDDDPEGP